MTNDSPRNQTPKSSTRFEEDLLALEDNHVLTPLIVADADDNARACACVIYLFSGRDAFLDLLDI